MHICLELPSLKLTQHQKIDGWKTTFILERLCFRGHVSYKEGITLHLQTMRFLTVNMHVFVEWYILHYRLTWKGATCVCRHSHHSQWCIDVCAHTRLFAQMSPCISLRACADGWRCRWILSIDFLKACVFFARRPPHRYSFASKYTFTLLTS